MYKCDLCNRKFSLKKYLSRHVKAIHYKQFQCKNCMKTYFSNKETKEHNCSAIPFDEKEKYSCLICNKIFLRDIYLKKHMKCHDNNNKDCKTATDNEKKFMCEICAKTFTKIANLNKHFKNHANPNLKCDVCEKEFFRKDVLDNHVLVTHKDEKFKCDECNKSFRSLKYLKIHAMQHGEKNYHCFKCKMSFVYRWNLNKHNRRFHDKIDEDDCNNKEARFVCPICKKRVKYKKSLLRHIKNSHPDSSVQLTNGISLKNDVKRDDHPVKDMNVLNYNGLNEFNLVDINTINDCNNLTNETIRDNNDERERIENANINRCDDNLNLQHLNDKEICLSMPDIPEVDQQITLSNYFLFN